MARLATNGLILPFEEAKNGLVDNKGNPIEFKEQGKGVFTSKEIDGDKDEKGNVRYVYSYSLALNPQMATVSVTKTLKNVTSTSKSK